MAKVEDSKLDHTLSVFFRATVPYRENHRESRIYSQRTMRSRVRIYRAVLKRLEILNAANIATVKQIDLDLSYVPLNKFCIIWYLCLSMLNLYKFASRILHLNSRDLLHINIDITYFFIIYSQCVKHSLSILSKTVLKHSFQFYKI